MFEISQVSLDYATENILVAANETEVLLQDIFYSGYINIHGTNSKVKLRPEAHPIDIFISNVIKNIFVDWKDRASKLNIIKRELVGKLKYYENLAPTYQTQKRFKVYQASIHNYASYNELFNHVKDRYTVKFKCNSFSGFVGAGLLIITKIKNEQVFVPLIITTTYTKHLPYFYLCTFLGEKPIDSFFNVYVNDLLINSINAELKNFRIAFKKLLLPELEKCNLSIADLEDFIVKAKVPNFKKLSDRKQFLETLSEDVLYSLNSDVAVKYR